MQKSTSLIACLLLFFACKKEELSDPFTPLPVADNWYVPDTDLSFDWRLDNVDSNTSFSAEVVDLDAFTTTKETIDELHAQGKKVFAYLSVGTVEDWRPDAGDFPPSVVGKKYHGWQGERWLDIRKTSELQNVMTARFDRIKAKGFDGIEPDNIDGYEYPNPGFKLTEANAISYCEWLINQAHARGLSIGQKNATGLATQLVDAFDWILLEDAFVDDFYREADIYVERGKAVFMVEYLDKMNPQKFTSEVCPTAQQKGYIAILKDRDLTAGKTDCF